MGDRLTSAELRTIFVWGAMGGMLPTLGRIAGTYAADFATPPPAWFGVSVAVVLYGLIGAVMARAIGHPDMKQALFAGIAAPAVILSVLNGATDTSARKKSVTSEVTEPVRTTHGPIEGFVWALGGERREGDMLREKWNAIAGARRSVPQR